MSKVNRNGLLALAAVLGLSALLLWQCCPAAPREPIAAEHAPATNAPAISAEPAVASPPPAATASHDSLAALEPAPSDDVAPEAEPKPAQRDAVNTVEQVLAQLDPVDLELYARIERETGHDVPRAVHALVAKRRSGATRAELNGDIQRTIADAQLRLMLTHWLAEAFNGKRTPVATSAASAGPALTRPLRAKPSIAQP